MMSRTGRRLLAIGIVAELAAFGIGLAAGATASNGGPSVSVQGRGFPAGCVMVAGDTESDPYGVPVDIGDGDPLSYNAGGPGAPGVWAHDSGVIFGFSMGGDAAVFDTPECAALMPRYRQ